MWTATLFATNLALAAFVSAQEMGVCPSPFELISIQGTIYGAANGVQIPAGSSSVITPTKFQLNNKGYLINSAGQYCSFLPWLICGDNTFIKDDTVAIGPNGGFGLTEFTNGSVFWACTPDGIGNSYIDKTATLYNTATSAASEASAATSYVTVNTTVPTPAFTTDSPDLSSATSATEAAFTSPGSAVTATATKTVAPDMPYPAVVPEYYILPDYLVLQQERSNAGCRRISLQALRCFSSNSTTTSSISNVPVATYSGEGSIKRTTELHSIGTFSGLIALLGAYLL